MQSVGIKNQLDKADHKCTEYAHYFTTMRVWDWGEGYTPKHQGEV